jgi:hypothetical protein
MIKQALAAYADTSVRVFVSDRSQTVGASEVGQCARKVFWTKNEGDPVYGAPRDPGYVDTWGARARGTIYENHWWEPALRSVYRDQLLYAGVEQQTFVSGFLSATPDGLIIGLQEDALAHLGVPDIGGDCIMAECKTADPRTNLSKPKPENVFQTQVQMGIVRNQTEWKPNYSLLTYTDASFWNEVLEFPIAFDPAVYEVAKGRAATIMTATSAADLKPEGWIAGGKECDYCPFTKACGIERTKVPDQPTAAVDPQFIAEITDLARAVKVLEASNAGTETRIRELQNELRDRLRAKGQRRIVADGVSVLWSPVKGRQSYDQKAIREAAVNAGVDIEQFSTVGEATDRLVIQVSEQSRSAA